MAQHSIAQLKAMIEESENELRSLKRQRDAIDKRIAQLEGKAVAKRRVRGSITLKDTSRHQ